MFVNVGVGRKALRGALARGDAVELHPGVYIAAEAVSGDAAVRHAQLALARQVRTPRLVASHETAALVHQLPLAHLERIAEASPRFTQAPAPSTRSSASVAVRPLPPAQVTDVSAGPLAGLRLTTPARTAIDLAAELDLPEALMLLDAVSRRSAARGSPSMRGAVSERLRATAVRPLQQARVARSHWSRRVSLALELADPRRESPAESQSFGYFAVAGLPLPCCQVMIETEIGVKWVDFGWPEFGVAGECHGAVKYDGTLESVDGVLVREAERHHAVESAGWSVVQWDARELLVDPFGVVDRIARRLEAHGWSGARSAGPGFRRRGSRTIR